LFEVIECSWVDFIKKVQTARALDDVLKAHEDFLRGVHVGIFLDNIQKHTLYLHLDIVYDAIVKLEDWQQTFYEKVFAEMDARKAFESDIVKSEKTGNYGVTTEKRLERDNDLKTFELSLSSMKKSLDGIGNSYEKYVNTFLMELAKSSDPNLQRFGTRLDFNEFYKKKNQQLNQQQTYEHMRMSGMGTSGIFNRSSLAGTPMRLGTSIIH
jgi:gamma-tubulin complex component 3